MSEQSADITADLLALGAGATLDLMEGKPYPLLPIRILISAPVEAIARVDGTPFAANENTIVTYYLKTNVVHEIGLKSIEKDNTTASPIVIIGTNI